MMNNLAKMARIAIVGEGVVGISTALFIQKKIPKAEITIFSDALFEKSCSYGPAGLFRIDNINWEKNRKYGKTTFNWLASLARTRPGSETGVKLLSGHIQSDCEENLKNQERAYADIVYNFRWLSEAEMKSQFENPAKYCIHYSAYAAEGNLYVPFLRSLLKNVVFEQKKVEDLAELGNNFDVIVNCAGLNGGKLAGDDNTVIPVRGIVALVDAPWHKQFLYRDFSTFTIPKNDVVVVGSVKADGDWRSDHDQTEVDEILRRYYEIQPAMKNAPVIGSWCALRPFRPSGIRIDSAVRKNTNGKLFSLVNHYGHGSNGFTLGWGSAQDAANLVEKAVALKSKL